MNFNQHNIRGGSPYYPLNGQQNPSQQVSGQIPAQIPGQMPAPVPGQVPGQVSAPGPPGQPQPNLGGINLLMAPQLANLTPEQLNQLKQQPNFQNILRAYMQKQYMQQQQQHLQRQQVQVPPVPPQAPQAPQAPPGMAQPQLMAQANARGPQISPGQGQTPPLQAPQGPHGLLGPQGPQVSSVPGSIPGSDNPNGNHKSALHFPPVPPEIMARTRFEPLSSYDHWSKKLKAEGKDVPGSLKVYESMISKEAKSKARNAKQTEANKQLTSDLIQDAKSYNELKQLRMNAISLSLKNQFNNSIWGEGYQGYGNGTTNTLTQLILPPHRKRFSGVPESLIPEREASRRILKQLKANPVRNLVPIRLEFEQERDRFKLRDTFLWDLNEKEVTIEQFVGMLLEDYRFISQAHMPTIIAAINEQIKDYQKHPEKTMGELRVPIKVNITLNNTQYSDQFEWDILNFEENDPEEFSSILCEEMSLPGEFSTAIAHIIREQTQLFHKSLYLVGYSFDGLGVSEDEIRSHLLPPLRMMAQEKPKDIGSVVDEYYSILRNPATVIDYSPNLMKLTQLELERLEKEIERESRRKRRHNTYEEQQLSTSSRGTSRRGAFHGGRGGPVLPDLSDIPKTFRTPQPSSVLPGGVDIGVPDVNGYDEVIVHRTQVPNPDYKPPEPKYKRVSYDTGPGSFMVKIKLGPPENQWGQPQGSLPFV